MDGRRINIFPDMSPDLARRHKQMIPALKAQKEWKISCYLHPACIKILTTNGGTYFVCLKNLDLVYWFEFDLELKWMQME